MTCFRLHLLQDHYKWMGQERVIGMWKSHGFPTDDLEMAGRLMILW